MHPVKRILDRAITKIEEVDAKLEREVPIALTRIRNILPRIHSYRQLDFKQLEGNLDIQILHPNAHSLRELGRFSEKFAPATCTSPMSKIQQAAYIRHTACAFWKYDKSREPDVQDIVREYLSIFDDLYFFSAVKNHITLEFRNLEKREAMGLTVSRWCLVCPKRFRNKTSIYIDPEFHDGDTLFKKVEALLGTLLHEMIHAFHDIYACKCREKECMREKWKVDGYEGHGPSWQWAALAIEKSAKNLLGFGNVELGREMALYTEICGGRKEWKRWPRPEEFEKLEIDPASFKEGLYSDWIFNDQGDRLREKSDRCEIVKNSCSRLTDRIHEVFFGGEEDKDGRLS